MLFALLTERGVILYQEGKRFIGITELLLKKERSP